MNISITTAGDQPQAQTLNLESNLRSLHPWQAFAKLFGNDLKDRVDNEWNKYKEANPEASHSPQARFKFHKKKDAGMV